MLFEEACNLRENVSTVLKLIVALVKSCKICKENVQRQEESQKCCRRCSRSSNYAIFGHFTGVVLLENKMTQNTRAGLLFTLTTIPLVHYSENGIIVSLT